MYDAYKPTGSLLLSISPAVPAREWSRGATALPRSAQHSLGLAGARWGSDRSSSASNTACMEGVLLALHSGLKNNLRIGCLNLNKIFPLSKAFFNFVNLQN